MRVDLEVIASTTIKRQRPWPRICWVGVEKQSLLLVDKKRVSVLYIPSGKTKHKIPQLSNVIVDSVCTATTPSGGHLVGLQKGGEVFVWNKDREDIKTICGFSSCLNVSALTPGCCQIFSSNDISKMIVAVNKNRFFLWQHSAASAYLEGKDHILAGHWSQVMVPESMEMPKMSSQEACLSGIFTSTSLMGDCFELSVVFNISGSLTICSLVMHFMPMELPEESYPSVSTQWKCLQHSLHNISQGCEAINVSGVYVAQYSHDGNMLAVAVNQKSPADTSILYISTFTDTLLSSEMKGCGVNSPHTKRGKQYWVRDMAWTYDNLFIACMLANGSAALLSRLGEPLIIATHGCSVEMGPSYFLPLHPFINVMSNGGRSRLKEEEFEPSSVEDAKEVMTQCFSVSAHPSLPVIVFSDGFVVTFVQLPGDISTFVLIRNLVLESSRHLQTVAEAQNLSLTIVNAYNLPAMELRVKASPRRPKSQSEKKLHFSFEEPDGTLNATVDSEASSVFGNNAVFGSHLKAGAIQSFSSGRIIFGDPDLMRSFVDSTGISETDDDVLKAVVSAKCALLTMWKLAVSSAEVWTANMDEVVKKGMENFVQLFSSILDKPQVSDALNKHKQDNPSTGIQNPSLFQVISLYRHLLEIAHFDALQQHLLHIILQLAHRTASTLLESQTLRQSDPRLKTLSGCFTLLKFTEKTLSSLYVCLPKSTPANRDNHKGAAETVHESLFSQELPVNENEINQETGKDETKEQKRSGLAFDTRQLVTKRLAGSWKMLYKAVVSHQQEVHGEHEYQQTRTLLFAIQQCLHAVNASIPQASALSISKGDRLSLDGKHTLAVNAWKEQLRHFQESGNEKNAAKLLHSLLYTHLHKMDLLSAVEMIDNLVVQENVQTALQSNSLTDMAPVHPSFLTFVTNALKSQAFHEPDMVPCIHDRAIRQVVQTLGRFMAAYFSNQPVYIFPPHNPQPLPSIHYQVNSLNNHILPKYHKDISAMVRQQKISGIWTVERSMEYLLLSGLICEAVWFADQMGNWKTAFQLASAWSMHHSIAPQVYIKPIKPLMLPDSLAPQEILHSKLVTLIGNSRDSTDVLISDKTDVVQLTATLEDVMIAGVMAQAEVAPRLLTALVSHLKTMVQQFSPLVPAEFYLPSPPVYCPQPASSPEVAKLASVKKEMSLRRQVSSLVQLTLAVMNAAHVSIPALHWYIHQLDVVQPKALQFKSNTEGPCRNFPVTLLKHLAGDSDFEQVKPNRSIYMVLCSFRDLCSLLWMLHARDTLSQNLRKREKFQSQLGYKNLEKSEWDREKQAEWLRLCWHCLQWAAHMLPYTRFLPDESSINKVLLSMLLELVPSMEVADLMAEFFHDMTDVHPDLQERLDKILFDWQSIILKPEDDGRSVRNSQDSNFEGKKSVTFHDASPRGESLSIYFHKQQQVVRKVLSKKRKCFGAYEEYVFAKGMEPPKKLHIGSRPAETKLSYFDFLDTFCAISFSKVLDKQESKDRTSCLPLLNCLCGDLVNQEMNFFVESVAAQAHKKQSHRSTSKSEHHVYQNKTAAESHRVQVLGPAGFFREGKVFDRPPERVHASVIGDRKQQETEPTYSTTQRSRQSRPSPRQEQLLGAANQQWSLTVNFGKRYTYLQQLLEWLEVWSNKQHNFGLGPLESKLEMKPSMKLQIPAQLIVLPLWLLEHKYTDTIPKGQGSLQRNEHHHGDHSTHLISQSVSPGFHDLTKHGNKHVIPAESRVRSKLESSPLLGSRGVKQTEQRELHLSLPLSTFGEEQEIRTAYEQVLDGPDDSSSLLVSSLASDELPDDLQKAQQGSPIPSRQDNDELNHTVFLERIQSPPDRPRNPTPRSLASTSALLSHSHASTSPILRSASTSPVHVQHSTPLHKPCGPTGEPDDSTSMPAPPGEGGLAQLLQQVIRKEMRRMVQIQQHSLAAMMGAIDGDTEVSIPQKVTANQTNLPPKSNPLRSSQGTNVRQALTELHNLQQQTSPAARDYSRSIEEEIIPTAAGGSLHMSALTRDRYQTEDRENIFPRADGVQTFLRLPAEREQDGFQLPPIPLPPQTYGSQKQSPQPLAGTGPFPLLRLLAGPPQPSLITPPPPASVMPFMVPPPPPAPVMPFMVPPPPPAPVMPFMVPPPPPAPVMPFMAPPPSYEQASQLQPLRFNLVQPGADRPKANLERGRDGPIGLPLLHFPVAGVSQTTQGPLFGRLVPPEYLAAQREEQEKQEAAKQRLLCDLHQQVAALQVPTEMERNLLQEDREQIEKSRDTQVKRTGPVKRMIGTRDKAGKTTPTPQESTASTDGEATRASGTLSDARSSQSEHEEEAENSAIHDGYAIPPGAFEGYEEMEGELGVPADTNTRFQYKMAQAMRRQLEAEKERWLRQRLVDFSVNIPKKADASVDVQRSFESVHSAEASTSVTRNAGVDPVREAFTEFSSKQQGVAVPPDIYMGLRFIDGHHEASNMADGVAKGRGRAFLNVVDVRASSVLRDIPERDQAGLVSDTGRITSDTIGSVEASLRAHLEPEKRRRHDDVTVRMFKHHTAGDDRVSVSLLPRSSVRESKTSLVQQLRTMNDQIAAVEEMSQNIEKDFHNSKMILETLQTINESYQSVDISHTLKDGAKIDQTDAMEESLSSKTPTAKISGGSPLISARITSRSLTSVHSKKSDSAGMSHLSNASGMSDISDIIGEVLAQGGVDLQAAGLTQEEADMLAMRAHRKHRSKSPKTSLEALKTHVTTRDHKDLGNLSEWRREEIHQWMADKYAERQSEYIKYRTSLKEQEVRPYRSPEKTQVGSRSLRTLEQERQHKRMMKEKQDAHHRILDAEYLIGSAMTDAALVLSKLSRSRSPSPKSRSRSQSASPSRSRSPAQMRLLSGSHLRPQQKESATSAWAMSDQRGRSRTRPTLDQTYRVSSPPKSILKTTYMGPTAAIARQLQPKPVLEETESEDADEQAAYSKRDLTSYVQAMEDLENNMDVRPGKENTKIKVEPTSVKPVKVYKPKSFQELVRLQRPEITRTQQPTHPPPEKYIHQALAEKAARRAQSARMEKSRETGIREPQRPKTADGIKKTAIPRQVKSYTERLQEMKPKQRYATPIIPRRHVPESVSSQSARSSMRIQRRRAGPPHKPMTYVEQLKKINAAVATTKRPGQKRGTANYSKTLLPSRTAPHKPKTYTQQLKELNAPFKRTFRSTARAPSASSSSRPRPYGDPYRVASEESLSVLSDWSVDENIRRLIYDDSQISVGYSADEPNSASVSAHNLAMAPSEAGASDYYDVIMGGSEPDLLLDYRDSVDISELERIAEVMSVGSGSVLSVVDWDAVDKLIEDV